MENGKKLEYAESVIVGHTWFVKLQRLSSELVH